MGTWNYNATITDADERQSSTNRQHLEVVVSSLCTFLSLLAAVGRSIFC